jgi:hypothetical protein
MAVKKPVPRTRTVDPLRGPCPASLYLASFLAAMAVLLTCRSLPAEEGNKEKAKIHFERAIKFFEEGNYKDALIDFEASYEYRPHWALKYNMALCHYYLKHDIEALTLLTEYLEEGQDSIENDRKASIHSFIAELKGKVGILVLENIQKNTIVNIDGEVQKTKKRKEEIFLAPGKHAIFIMTGESIVIDQDMVFSPGKKIELYAGIAEGKKPVEEKKESNVVKRKAGAPVEGGSKLKTTAWITLGIGAALLVGGAAAGGVTLKEKDLREQAEDDYLAGYYGSATEQELIALQESQKEHLSKTRQAFASSVALLSAGGILAAASIVLFAISSKKREKPKQEGHAALAVTPWSLGISLSF